MRLAARFWVSVLACSISVAASGQMAVHAMTGMVKSVKPTTISVTDSSSENSFKVEAPNGAVKLASDLLAESTTPAKFDKTGDFVLVYFYGWGTDRTAVAVKDLGAGPFMKTQGTVTSFDKHSRKLTLKDDSGKELEMVLGNDLVVDTESGVDTGKKFAPHKGDQVRVTYLTGATPTVVFLRETL